MAPDRNRAVRWVAWFLAVSYGLGAVLTAFLELDRGLFSQRFDLPPYLFYLTCLAQVVCAVGVLRPRLAFPAAAALTVITLGAIGVHLRIGSPLTAIPAAVYTVIQVWFAMRSRPRAGRST